MEERYPKGREIHKQKEKKATMERRSFLKLAVMGIGPSLLLGRKALCAGKSGVTISGAGASFPYPVYSQWAYKYQELTGMKLNYQSIGSGGGISQIKAGTVDFGASDAPLLAGQLTAAGLVQFPMIMGGVVTVFNLPGIEAGKVKLTPDTLAGIFMGRIRDWSDAAIKGLNPDVNLPAKAITVVHRADASGTSWIFTNYLDKVSDLWHQSVGTDKTVAWPCGVGGKGNEGVAAQVQQIEGAIGYVEYAYALQNNMSYTQLKNRSGAFVMPTIKSFQAACANADWQGAPGYYMVLTDQAGEESWPITGASFILVHSRQNDAARCKAMLEFFDWCYRHGADIAENLHYVPVPLNVVDLVEKTWNQEIRCNDQPVWGGG